MATIDWNAYLDAWNRHDGAAVASFFTPGGAYEDVALGQRAEGTEGIRKFVDDVAVEFSSDYVMTLGHRVVAEDGYAAEWTFSGTHDGHHPMLPTTGKKYAIRGVSIGTIRDGKIVENRDYWDMAAFLGQVGLMPAPEGAPAG